jgi:hypothetical protein
MEFEVTITLADSREDPDFPEALFEGFLPISPGCDVVVSRDGDDGEVQVWLMCSADDAASASQVAIAALRDVETTQPLIPTTLHVAAATEHTPRAA